MSHTPFIIASYAIAAVLMAWCALSPILKQRKLLRNLRSQSQVNNPGRSEN